MDLEQYIRDVPDFPQKGIIFKDISPLLGNVDAFRAAADAMARPFTSSGVELVAGVESRGFIFGMILADRLDAGFVPVRKPGKLPAETVSESYDLEYGSDSVEMHRDAIKRGQKVLMVDDLLATGGTMSAACRLVERLGGDIVGVTVLIELAFLAGRAKLPAVSVHSVISVSGE